MRINSAEIETVYHIEYTFEDFVGALEDPNLRLGRPNAFKDLPDKWDEHTDGILLKAFQNLSFWGPGCHGDTFSALAQKFGFDGWKNAGHYDNRRDVRTLTVYRKGADNLEG